MTYNLFGETLNIAQSVIHHLSSCISFRSLVF